MTWPTQHRPAVSQALEMLYDVYLSADADLVEVNPLVLTDSGEVMALDAKVSIDPGSLPRQPDIVERRRTWRTRGAHRSRATRS